MRHRHNTYSVYMNWSMHFTKFFVIVVVAVVSFSYFILILTKDQFPFRPSTCSCCTIRNLSQTLRRCEMNFWCFTCVWIKHLGVLIWEGKMKTQTIFNFQLVVLEKKEGSLFLFRRYSFYTSDPYWVEGKEAILYWFFRYGRITIHIHLRSKYIFVFCFFFFLSYLISYVPCSFFMQRIFRKCSCISVISFYHISDVICAANEKLRKELNKMINKNVTWYFSPLQHFEYFSLYK